MLPGKDWTDIALSSSSRFQRLICLGRVQIIALDIENSVPASAIVLECDLRAQLHQLFLGELFSQTRIQIVRDIRWRICHRVGQFDDKAFRVIE